MTTTDDREAAGRAAYEQHLRDSGIAAQANAVPWDALDQTTKQQWIDQAAEDDGDEPTVSSAEKTAKATKAARSKADDGK
jgi:hypothetical protein